MQLRPLATCSMKKLWALVLGKKHPLTDQQIYLLQHSSTLTHIQNISHYSPLVAQKIAACLEISRRISEQFQKPAALHSPLAIYHYTKDMIHAPQEIVRALYLNSQLQVIGDEIIAIGSLNTAQISVRELLRPAILCNAHTFVIVHNHPSGDPMPSADDCRLTKYIASIGILMNILLQDHLIIANEGYTSVRSEYPELFQNNA